MFSSPRFICRLSLFSTLLSAFLFSQSIAAAQESPLSESFSEFDQNSTITINHEPLSANYRQTVFPVGRSMNRLWNKNKETFAASHIVYGNTRPSRFEGNRVFFHAFSEAHKAFFEGYQLGLENLSNRQPLANLNKNEQLAFWLNLHNVIVINKLVDEYPISRLRGFRLGGSGKDSYWTKKVTTIEGVSLSLNDIERIVIENWDNPIVIYGFFQGSVGGPSLPREAFDGENVWELLEANAIEFVNSNRGVRPKNGRLEVSDFYEWVMAAFRHSKDNLRTHIGYYADENFLGDISGLHTIQFDYYDWYIADIMEGSYHVGDTTNPAAILGATSDESNSTLQNVLLNYLVHDMRLNTLPARSLNLFNGIVINNDVPFKTPVVTVEECRPGDDCYNPQDEKE